MSFPVHGKPLGSCAVVVSDRSCHPPKPVPLSRLDSQGYLPGNVLEPGHRYFIQFLDRDLPSGGNRGYFTYHGQKLIEVPCDPTQD